MKRIASYLLCLVLLFSVPALSEISYTDAEKSIKLHNQYKNYAPTGGLKEGAQGYYDARNFQIQNGKYWCWWGNVYGVDCLEQGGCHAFAFSHAVQWLKMENLGDEVLHELISACENPSDYASYHQYPKCRNSLYSHNTSTEAYCALCRSKYGLNTDGDTVPDRTQETWLAFFNSGKIAVLLVNGHYNLAVDYLEYEDGVYVQILDSAPNASVTRTWHSAYMVVQHKKLYKTITPAFAMGPFQYWVKMEDFLDNYIGIDAVLSGGSWSGHAS